MSDSIAISQVLDRVVARAGELYALPQVVTRVRELAEREPVDVAALKATLELDPALASKILRLANSSYFGLRGEVGDLTHAIQLLGSHFISTLALTFSLPDCLFRQMDAQVLERYWRQAACRALLARRLQERLGGTPNETLFAAALLQSIGMLALIHELGDTYTQFAAHVLQEGADLADEERSLFGFTHVAVSSRLLAHWGLPATLVELIHQEPGVQAANHPTSLERNVLRVADLAAEFLIAGQPSFLLRALDAATPLGATARETLRSVLAEIENDMRLHASLFCFTPPATGSFTQRLAAAEHTLAQRTSAEICPVPIQPEAELLVAVDGLRQELASVARALRVKLPSVHLPAEQRAIRPVRESVRGCSTLLPQLTAAVGRCRNARCSLSFVLVALQPGVEIENAFPAEQLDRAMTGLRRLCRRELPSVTGLIAVGDACLGLLMEGCERAEAVAGARHLLEQVRHELSDTLDTLRLSAGVGAILLPPRNFRCPDLLEATLRCLSAAQSCGSDAVKSIEL